MPRLLKATAAAFLALFAAFPVLSPLAADFSPVGSWQVASGEARFRVSSCGDGAELCAKLVWLKPELRTRENLKYMNKYVLRGAQPVQPNKWRGTVNYQGQTVGGSLTLVNANTMVLTGCQLVVCQTFDFKRL